MIAFCGKQSLFLHFAQFVGEGTAVYTQIICQLLAAERDVEFSAAVFHGLIGKIGQQPATDGFGRGVENASGEIQIFSGGNRQQIADDFSVMTAVVRAYLQDPCYIQKPYFCLFRSH